MAALPTKLKLDRKRAGWSVEQTARRLCVAVREYRAPGDRGWGTVTDVGDVGSDLQTVRLGPDVRIWDPPLMQDVGAEVVTALGEPAARELLDVLERSDADRAALIGRLHVRDDAAWLAELLIDLEDDVGEMARLRLVDDLRRTLDA